MSLLPPTNIHLSLSPQDHLDFIFQGSRPYRRAPHINPKAPIGELIGLTATPNDAQ